MNLKSSQNGEEGKEAKIENPEDSIDNSKLLLCISCHFYHKNLSFTLNNAEKVALR